MGLGALLGMILFVPEVGVAADAGLSFGDLTSTSTSDVTFCTIYATVRDLMIMALPLLTVLILVISTVLWVISGSKEDFLTLAKNLVVKMMIGIGFILIFNMIISILGGVISETSELSNDESIELIRSGGRIDDESGEIIITNCKIEIWHNVKSFNDFEAETFFSSETGNNLKGIIKDLINLGMVSVGMIATLMILWGGVQYISAVGAEGATKARNTIMYASAGVLIVWLARMIVIGFTALL